MDIEISLMCDFNIESAWVIGLRLALLSPLCHPPHAYLLHFKEIRVYDVITLLYQAQSAKHLQKCEVLKTNNAMVLVISNYTDFLIYNFVMGNKKNQTA